MRSLEKSKLQRQIPDGRSQGLGWGGGELVFDRDRASVWEVRKFWRRMVEMVVQQCA